MAECVIVSAVAQEQNVTRGQPEQCSDRVDCTCIHQTRQPARGEDIRLFKPLLEQRNFISTSNDGGY